MARGRTRRLNQLHLFNMSTTDAKNDTSEKETASGSATPTPKKKKKAARQPKKAKAAKKKAPRKKKRGKASSANQPGPGRRSYPKVTIEKALQVAIKIKELNGGNPWTPADIANAVGMGPKTPDFYYLTAAS